MKTKWETEIFNKEEILNHMETKWAGKKVIFLSETASTNEEAVKEAQTGAEHGTLIVADSQTQGKGRRGRTWYTKKGTCIAMSLILKPKMETKDASMLTLVQAMAVAKSIEEACGLKTKIKWPNDILVNNKKVCGILTELYLNSTEISSIIIGTGINVNQEEFPTEISQIATSLKREKKESQSRIKLIKRICELFEQYYEGFLKTGDVSCFLEEYNEHLVSREKRVRVLEPKGEFEGQALGINLWGELLVKKDDGEVVRVYAGEVSVRGVYGYV